MIAFVHTAANMLVDAGQQAACKRTQGDMQMNNINAFAGLLQAYQEA